MADDTHGLRCPSCGRYTMTCYFAEAPEAYSPQEGFYSDGPDHYVHRCSNPGCGHWRVWEAPCGCDEDHVSEPPPPPPIPIDPAWLTWNDGCVVALAREIHQKRDAAALPILADALEDAGCADPRLFGPCRAATFPDAQAVLNRLLGG